MTEHFFDLKNFGTCLQQILSVGVSQPIGCGINAGIAQSPSEILANQSGAYRLVRGNEQNKQLTVFDFWPCADNVGDNSLENAFRYRQLQWAIIFPIFQGQLRFRKGDVVECNPADFRGTQA
jgi:hypothetical protein